VKPKTRYARDGDISIAFRVFGEGPVELLHTWGPATFVEYMWEHPRIVRFYDRLGSFARVALFDRRGTGGSDPTPGPPTLEQQMEDMGTVIESGRVRASVSVWGKQREPPVRHVRGQLPGSCRRADLVRGLCVGSDVLTPPLAALLDDLIENAWGRARRSTLFAPSESGRPPHHRVVRQPLSGSPPAPASSDSWSKWRNRSTSARFLPAIRVPTVVMHRRDDPMVDFELGRQVADAIPGARFIPWREATTFRFFGDSEAILDEVEEFVTGQRRHFEAQRILTTVMFTDIVGSTQTGSRPRGTATGGPARRSQSPHPQGGGPVRRPLDQAHRRRIPRQLRTVRHGRSSAVVRSRQISTGWASRPA
jgi:pimeloyl-ACP methyl ester carboxylesterase